MLPSFLDLQQRRLYDPKTFLTHSGALSFTGFAEHWRIVPLSAPAGSLGRVLQSQLADRPSTPGYAIIALVSHMPLPQTKT